jgi:hypothetical protein
VSPAPHAVDCLETLMAKKQQQKNSMSKKKRAKKQSLPPRVKLTRAFVDEMERLKDDLDVIVPAKADEKGKLKSAQLDKAKKMKKALDQAVTDVFCVQALVAY